MHTPSENENTRTITSPVLAAEDHLRSLGCEGISLGRSNGVWGARSGQFPGGRLLVCEPREAFAMRMRSEKSEAVAVVPLVDGTRLVHQGSVIPDGGAGFSEPGIPQIVHARGGTSFAVLWIVSPGSPGDAKPANAVLPSPANGHFGHALAAIPEGDAGGLARFAAWLADMGGQAIVASVSGNHGKPPRRLAKRMSLVAGLWDFISSRLEDNLPLELLERETGKSSRTLEYAFTEIVGRTPIAFIKALRMRQARRLLLEGRHPSVKKAASECGLWHFGRFSIDYRQQFGELPSEVLKAATARGE